VSRPLPAPGWYPDPAGAPMQRFFDGTRWTEHRAPLAAPRSMGPVATNPRPSGTTGVLAGVLALLGGLSWALPIRPALNWIFDTTRYPVSGGSARQWFVGAALVSTVVLLLSGAGLLLARRRVGRLLIVSGCAINIAMLIVQALFPANGAIAEVAFPGLAVFPLVTIVLALAPSTRRWCKS
jgi:Protein of unknown function (DUF2510)